jgi:hypothetical protein
MALDHRDYVYSIIPGSSAIACKNAASALAQEYELGQQLYGTRSPIIQSLDFLLERAMQIAAPVIGGFIELYAMSDFYHDMQEHDVFHASAVLLAKVGTYAFARHAEEYGKNKYKELQSLRE